MVRRRWEDWYEHIPALSGVGEDVLRRTCSPIATRVLDRKSVVWDDGDPAGEFTFVAAGRIKLVKHQPDGRHTILDLVGAGRLLCANVPYWCGRFCCSAIVDLEPTVTLTIVRSQFIELLARHPLVMQGFIEELSGRTITMCSRVGELGGGRVDQRIARVLMRLAAHLGVSRPGGELWVSLPLSRRDIADLTGTTVESAIRVMSRLEKDGVVTTEPGGFWVHSSQSLSGLAEGLDSCRSRRP